jgi:glutamate/tyrosine decarboxylase-like PLP-dependent enzyme
MSPESFRELGHRLVDRIAGFLETMPAGPVTSGETPEAVRALVGRAPLPDAGTAAAPLLDEAADLLFGHSLFNGHPRFWGFITASAAPIGALADLLAAAVNPNTGGWLLAPSAVEIERQCVRWIAELLGYPTDCGGLLVSGGNVANFVGFWVGRRVKAPWDLRSRGFDGEARTVRVYTSQETHTWIQKAADLSGMGTDAIRWIPTDPKMRMDTTALRKTIEADIAAGDLPLLVVGTAGSTSTGAIDALDEVGEIARAHGLWFHVDGAYGAPAAALPESPAALKALSGADSLAIDPHKWLYAPLEAGCTLVRDEQALRDTFSYHPPYYPDSDESAAEPPTYYHEFGPQNSRGFRALKVWLGIRQAGRSGYVRMIRDDIALARRMYELAEADPEMEAVTLGLSVATFRFVPRGFDTGRAGADSYLDTLNRILIERMQEQGEAFVSNAVVNGRYLLRACVVNFRTTDADVAALMDVVRRLGRSIDAAERPPELA